MKNRNGGVVVAVCSLAMACGTNLDSQSEALAKRTERVDGPALVSPDFPLDRDLPPAFDPNAVLLSVAASTSAGYLLAYRVPHEPDYWSHDGSVAFSSDEVVLIHWDAGNGAPTRLAKLTPPAPGAAFGNVRLVDVGSGWLAVYEVASPQVLRYSVSIARDGTVGPAVAVPGVCSNGLAGFARSASTALLTDSCGTGVVFDLTGQVSKTMTIATRGNDDPTSPFSSCLPSSGFYGGQLAFNGIDYFALYYCYSNSFPKAVVGIPISPSGDVGVPITVASSPAVPYASVASLSIAASTDGRFLVVLAEGQSSGPNTAVAYRTVSETSAHVFSVSAERVVPGESTLNDGQSSDRLATALPQNGNFVIARQRANGNFDLVIPSASGTGTDTTQALPTTLSGAQLALASSNDPLAGASKLLIGAGGRAVRFDASNQPLDVPPAILLTAQRGQYMPSVAFDGTTYLAAWTEAVQTVPGWNSGAGPQIFAHRLSPTGALLGGTSFELNPSTAVGLSPRLVGNSGFFSSAWDTWGSKLAGAAKISDADPPVVMPYAPAYTPPAAAPLAFAMIAEDAQTTLAWTGYSTNSIAQLASPTWPTPLNFGQNTGQMGGIALACDAGEYIVLWNAPGDPGERVVYGARVSPDMALLDSAPKEILRVAAPSDSSTPLELGVEAIAAGDHFVVAWTDVVGGNDELRIGRLSTELRLLDTSGVLVNAQPYPSVVAVNHRYALEWDGNDVWVVWRDNEDGARRPYASLRGRRFSDALAPVDTDSLLIASDLDEFSEVTLARGSEGTSLVGYTRSTLDTGFRARGRFLSSSAFAEGMPCSSAAQCQGGACISASCSSATGAGGAGGGATSGQGGAGDDGTAESGGSNTASGGFDVDGTSANAGEPGAAGSAGSDDGTSAGAADLAGAPSAGNGHSGAAGSPTAGSAGNLAVGGQAAAAGSMPEPSSCSCRVVGGKLARDRVPALAGLLVALTALFVRRRTPTPAARRVREPN